MIGEPTFPSYSGADNHERLSNPSLHRSRIPAGWRSRVHSFPARQRFNLREPRPSQPESWSCFLFWVGRLGLVVCVEGSRERCEVGTETAVRGLELGAGGVVGTRTAAVFQLGLEEVL